MMSEIFVNTVSFEMSNPRKSKKILLSVIDLILKKWVQMVKQDLILIDLKESFKDFILVCGNQLMKTHLIAKNFGNNFIFKLLYLLGINI